jgi:hypothetical protein
MYLVGIRSELSAMQPDHDKPISFKRESSQRYTGYAEYE